MRIGIIGLGLIGGTIALSLKENHHISAYDISPETLTYAIKNGIIHEKFDSLKDFISYNEVFYLCLYPKDIVSFITKNKNLFNKGSIIIEISGVKQTLVQALSKENLEGFDFVFSHPVAGSEKIGVYHSNANIFKNANYVITPVEFNHKNSIELTKKLALEMGFSNVSIVSPKVHDDIIAYTSQLTHVLSLSLVNSISSIDPQIETEKFIGDSYRDLTRISNINEKLWPDLFVNNKEALVKHITAFENELKKFKDAIIMNDKIKLEDMMKSSTKIRKSMNGGVSDDS